MRTNTKNRIRCMAGLAAATGIALLTAPGPVAVWSSGSGRAPDTRIVRVLGGRQLVQGGVQMLRPRTGLVTAGALVDSLHMLSMLAAALAWPAYRRPALISAAVAGTFTAAAATILAADRP